MRDDLALMISGERVVVDIGQFTGVSMEISSKEQIYSAMVIYGLLTYRCGEVLIPIMELMDRFRKLLISKEAFEYVYRHKLLFAAAKNFK